MTFCCGSESADPCLWLMDPDLDTDPTIYVINLQDGNKNLFWKSFSAYYFLKVHLHSFSKIKVKKKSQNSRNQGFSFYFCLIVEGYRFRSVSIALVRGSGSRRSKNIRIWRIRIHNAGLYYCWLFSTPSVIHLSLDGPYLWLSTGRGRLLK